jgi:predicted O-methyltransferase YrrM
MFDLFLKENPEAVLSLIFFDMDIYKPTAQMLKKIQKFITKGSVIVFDEVCDELSPGETIALREVIGTNKIKLKRWQFNSRLSYYIVE